MNFIEAQRLQKLPPYLFARIEQLIDHKKAQGVDVISLGIGDPDMPTPDHIIEELIKEARNPVNHQYPSSVGMLEFRQAVAGWYKRLFNVELDPKNEIVNLIGSKEGIAHICWCYLDPGDISLVPDPGYPVYGIGSILAGAQPHYMPLLEKNKFLPDFSEIPTEVAKKAKMMFLNYPNNPTGAVADENFFREAIAFSNEFGVLICHDAPYSEITYDGYRHPSFLQVNGGKEAGIEFHSMSKTFNMTGWRIGWAAGNPDAINALGRFKSNIDSGQFQAIQKAAVAGLNGTYDELEKVNKIYSERRDIVIDCLNSLGWQLEKPRAAFYLWIPVPSGHTSESFAELVLEKTGVVITPGTGYGANGAGYCRISISVDTGRLKEAMERIRQNIGKVSF